MTVPPASPLLPTYVVRATVTHVDRSVELKIMAIVNVDGTLSAVAESHNTAGYLPVEEVPQDMMDEYKRLRPGDRLRVAIKSLSRGPAAPVRCSLRPEARHQAYILELCCHPDDVPDALRSLHRQSFFCNPASATTLARHYGIKRGLSLLPHAQQAACEPFSVLRKRQDTELAMSATKIGVEHQRAGRFPEALRCYARALQLEPHNSEALTARGALHAKTENFEAALQDLQAALEIDPGHENAKLYLEITHLRRGKARQERGKMIQAAEDFGAAAALQGPKRDEAIQHLQDLKTLMDRRTAKTEREVLAARASFQADSVSSKRAADFAAVKSRVLGDDSDESSDSDDGAASANDNGRDHHQHRHHHRRERREGSAGSRSSKNKHKKHKSEHKKSKKAKKGSS